MPKPSDLVDLGFGRGLAREAMARSIWRADTAMGVLSIQSAYRDWDEQMRLYLAYQRDPKHNPLAIHPDASWHCKGLAIDTNFRPTVRLQDYGFRFDVRSEPWHGQYYSGLDKFYGQTSGGGSNPFPIPGDDMYNDADRARDNATAARVDEIRQILYSSGLGQILDNTAVTRQALYTTPADPGGWAGVQYQLGIVVEQTK